MTASGVKYVKDEKTELDGPVAFYTMEVRRHAWPSDLRNSEGDDVKKAIMKP